MKEFISTNNLTMVEGKLFNWQKEPIYYGQDKPFVYTISIGGFSKMHTAVYNETTHELSFFDINFGSEFLIGFYCETIYDAEKIVDAYLKLNDKEFDKTIYYKSKRDV